MLRFFYCITLDTYFSKDKEFQAKSLRGNDTNHYICLLALMSLDYRMTDVFFISYSYFSESIKGLNPNFNKPFPNCIKTYQIYTCTMLSNWLNYSTIAR